MTNLVSVIIPSYNHEKYVLEAVNSVLNQSYSEIELIVIDDGSKDQSVEYLKQIKDSRFQLVVQENQGAHVAINRGLGMASGEFLAILNSDDIYYPNRIKQIMAEFQKDEKLDLVSSWIEVINEKGDHLAIKEGWQNLEPWPVEHPELSYKVTNDFILNIIMWNFVATTSNIVIKKRLFEKVGGMRNLLFAHDWDFLLRAASNGKCHLIPEPLIKYRVHGNNTISTDKAWLLFENCWVLAANIHRFEGSYIFNSNDPNENISQLVMLFESINFQ